MYNLFDFADTFCMEKTIWLYIKAEKNIQISHAQVIMDDIAKLYCSDKHVLASVKQMPVMDFTDYQTKHCAVSVLKLIELLKKAHSHLEVINLGESDLLLEYKTGVPGRLWQYTKIALICLITFFGTGFTIIAFHNDIGIRDVFMEIYFLVTGEESSGFTILEISYSIGLAIGIITFFNHVGGRRLSTDPTPIEVSMRNYEDDVNNTMVETMNREGKSLDVD